MRNVDTLEKYGMRSITWKNLCLSEKVDLLVLTKI